MGDFLVFSSIGKNSFVKRAFLPFFSKYHLWIYAFLVCVAIHNWHYSFWCLKCVNLTGDTVGSGRSCVYFPWMYLTSFWVLLAFWWNRIYHSASLGFFFWWQWHLQTELSMLSEVFLSAFETIEFDIFSFEPLITSPFFGGYFFFNLVWWRVFRNQRTVAEVAGW